jgi:hypothetical protein
VKNYQTIREAFVAEALNDMDKLATRMEKMQRRQEGQLLVVVLTAVLAAMTGGWIVAVVLLKTLGIYQ